MKRPIITFAIVYIILEFATIFIIFGWNAFGGSNNKNGLQRGIEFLFGFPSRWIFENNGSILINVVPNTIFWTLIFALIYLGWKKLKN